MEGSKEAVENKQEQHFSRVANILEWNLAISATDYFQACKVNNRSTLGWAIQEECLERHVSNLFGWPSLKNILTAQKVHEPYWYLIKKSYAENMDNLKMHKKTDYDIWMDHLSDIKRINNNNNERTSYPHQHSHGTQ